MCYIAILVAINSLTYYLFTIASLVGICVLVSVLYFVRLVYTPFLLKQRTNIAFLIVFPVLLFCFPSTSKVLNPKNSTMAIPLQKNPSRLMLYNSDVVKIYSCSDSTASRKVKQCKDALAKKDHQTISIKEFCEYFGLDYSQTLNFLEVL